MADEVCTGVCTARAQLRTSVLERKVPVILWIADPIGDGPSGVLLAMVLRTKDPQVFVRLEAASFIADLMNLEPISASADSAASCTSDRVIATTMPVI